MWAGAALLCRIRRGEQHVGMCDGAALLCRIIGAQAACGHVGWGGLALQN